MWRNKQKQKQKRNDNDNFVFKLVLVGDTYSGKTCLLDRYLCDRYLATRPSDIGVSFKMRTLDMDGKKVVLKMWDTPGTEQSKQIISHYIRSADAIVFVYDVTDMATFKNIPKWRHYCDSVTGRKSQVREALVGTKCDLTDLTDRRQVSKEEARALAATTSMMHMETSAQNSTNIEALFSDLTRDLIATFESGK